MCSFPSVQSEKYKLRGLQKSQLHEKETLYKPGKDLSYLWPHTITQDRMGIPQLVLAGTHRSK